MLGGLACAFILFNSYAFFSSQQTTQPVRPSSILRRASAQAAPAAAPPGRTPPAAVVRSAATRSTAVQPGGATEIQCTNMAGPWFRKGQAHYRTYRSVSFETPYRSEPRSIPPQLEFFPLAQLRLRPGTRFAAAERVNLQYLLNMPTDSLLFAWRALAKLPQPAGAVPLRSGWEHPGSELRGHFLGHWLSAAAFAWASGGGDALRAKMEGVVAALAECAVALGGYLSAFPSSHLERFERIEPVWAPYYCIDKVMQGLVDQHAVAGSTLAFQVRSELALCIRNTR